MSGRLLLDTNIVIAIFAEEPPVLERMAAAEEVVVPAVALGELYCDALTAQQYGRIKNDLRAKGRPIPENDIWIGAVGMQHGLTVATRDHDHFSQISGLAVEVW